ncbi:MAG TPA: hypothetical protein VIL69_02810 [Roseomonas sp.]|jgi:hypothetical protein
MRKIVLALALAVAGCAAAEAPVPPVPPLAGMGNRNLAMNAIQGAAEAFANPAALQGRPAEAAVAISRLEWAALAVPADRSFYIYSGMTAPALTAARWEVRRAVGISTNAPGPVVIAGMEGAAAALARGDTAAAGAALPPPTFAPDTLARLAHLPHLPQANSATLRATRDIEFGRSEDWEFP